MTSQCCLLTVIARQCFKQDRVKGDVESEVVSEVDLRADSAVSGQVHGNHDRMGGLWLCLRDSREINAYPGMGHSPVHQVDHPLSISLDGVEALVLTCAVLIAIERRAIVVKEVACTGPKNSGSPSPSDIVLLLSLHISKTSKHMATTCGIHHSGSQHRCEGTQLPGQNLEERRGNCPLPLQA